MRASFFAGVWCSLFVPGRSQAHLEVAVQPVESKLKWTTTNARLSQFAAEFVVCFDHVGCESTLPSQALTEHSLPVGANAVVDRFVTPEHAYDAMFSVVPGATPQINAWDLGAPVTVCKNVIYAGDAPPECFMGHRADGVCSGSDQLCRYAARLGDRPVVAVFRPELQIDCTDTIELQTHLGWHSVCADADGLSVYKFNAGVHRADAAVVLLPTYQQAVYVDIRPHDEFESGVFAAVLVVALVVWVRSTGGGSIASQVRVLPTDVQRLLVVDVSFSIMSTALFSVAYHGEGLVPASAALAHGQTYARVTTVLFMLLHVVASVIVNSCLSRRMTPKSTQRALLLRHVLEVQFMLSLHFFLPSNFGWKLRLLLGLFVGMTTLVVIGRDSFWLRSLNWQALGAACGFFGLAVHHATMVCVFPIFWHSSGIANTAATVTTVAVSALALLYGSTLTP